MTVFAVRVPEADIADLQALLDSTGVDVEPEVAHPFDGETVAQAILTLSAGAFPFFVAWVRHRAGQRKHFSVVHDGTELRGYTTAEAERLLRIVGSTIPELSRSEEDDVASSDEVSEGADN